MSKPNEMSPPHTVLDDPKARGILRVWLAHNRVHLAFSPKTWEDPAAWGILIVDLMNHLARAYDAEQVMGFDKALARIRGGLDAEWNAPTDVGTTDPGRTN